MLEIIAERVIAMIRGGLCQSLNKVVLAMLGEAQQYIYLCSNRTNATSVSFQSAVSTGITFQQVPLHVPSAFYCVQNLVFSADMEYVKNFTKPDFQAKSFTPQKCDIFLAN